MLLEKNPSKIFILDKQTYAANKYFLNHLEQNPECDKVKVFTDDIKNAAQYIDKLSIDIVINLAAESHVDNSIKNPDAFIQTNIVGTTALLRAFTERYNKSDRKKDMHFHHVSTDEVYGALNLQDEPFKTSTQYDPRSPG